MCSKLKLIYEGKLRAYGLLASYKDVISEAEPVLNRAGRQDYIPYNGEDAGYIKAYHIGKDTHQDR